MSGNYERVFVVAVPVERAWRAFTEPEERAAWMVPPGNDPFENPGKPFPAEGFPTLELKVGAIEPYRLLRWSQAADAEPRGWIETTITFEEVEVGTRISVTRSGFGDSEEWELLAQSSGLGWDESLADLVLYLETGVRASRHYTARSSIGASMRQTGAGLGMAAVVPGGFAAQAGLQEGDILVRLGGVEIFQRPDVWAVQRAHRPGDEVDVEYVRGRELLQGRAAFSEANYTEHHGRGGA